MWTLPGIRHLRYVVLAWQFWHWWVRIGRHLWLAPNESDLRHLEDVWAGRA